ncbi:MAG: hypothetical protein D6747_03970 [Chlorobiota bacterium]|nr:MAG: hypothetical protein D6747_03970 [Chlorobiota bacterium]
MCAKYWACILLVALALGCTVLEPAMLEGRWELHSLTRRDSSAIGRIAAAFTTLALSGRTVEFRAGQLLLPLGPSSDTLRLNYRLRGDTLQLLLPGEEARVRLRVARLDQHELRLDNAEWMLLFYRLQ